ncbi:hypothetical protein [Corynebacterium terpenotabidum]|uniref:hypothetical protein n=1 Tax=Corynebacterium terpenotabidum TaxID=89154 RepID=UPI0012ED46BD|nr:hypothetical protein [Corynebacterium terpenotabidum]
MPTEYNGDFPIRRGYYNSTTDRGYGYDKADHKHNLCNTRVIENVSLACGIPLYDEDGRLTFKDELYEIEYVDGKAHKTGKWVEIVVMVETDDLEGRPGDQMGLVTAYCSAWKGYPAVIPDEAGNTRRPAWVNNKPNLG